MSGLKCYDTFTRGNIDKNEIVPIRIFTGTEIDEETIERINEMPFDEVEKISHIYKWKIWRKN